MSDTYTKEEINEKLQEVKDTMYYNIKLKNCVYGFRIKSNESDCACSVVYLRDAVNAMPAYMNFSTGTFNYGSWKNAFFMPRPCMLKFDGTVDYYLDPNDFAFREDGLTASDISNNDYEGNAMIEWPKIWYKIVPIASRDGSADIFISDHQDDEDFVCWSFYDKDNVVKDHFYTPIYNGTVVNGKLRSLSGKVHTVNTPESTLIGYAEANGDGWNAECYCDRVLINCLLVLISKSLNSQFIFGYGHYTGGENASSNLKTGLLDSKGMFWGSTGNTSVKVFGMENYYAESWRFNLGVINDKGTYKIKLTPNTADESEATEYNLTGDGYISMGSVPTNGSSYISKMSFDRNCMLPITVNGNTSTYYADGFYTNNAITAILISGGSSCDSWMNGIFAFDTQEEVSISNWNCNCSISYR